MNTIQIKYKEAIASFLGVSRESIFLYWKGRIALYAALKAFGVGKNDEVIIPAFTCVVVPNSIIYLGAKPIYTDVDLSSMCATLKSIEAKITDRTKVIIIQNMLGLSNEVEEIIEMAKGKGIYCIEDCTHGFGGIYNDKPNGTLSDMAFYSTQWNKPFSTGVGGILCVNNPYFLDKVNELNHRLITPNFKTRFSLSLLIKIKKYILNDSTYWFLIRLYRKLSKLGLVIGSSNKEEITGIKQPENYFMAAGNVQAITGISELKRLNKKLEERKDNGLIYNELFRKLNSFHFSEILLKNHSFLKYPILVKDRKKFMALAENAKIRLGDWFISPIHPVEEGFEEWQLHVEDYPNALFLTKHIVNLPTDDVDVYNVISFINLNKDQLLEL